MSSSIGASIDAIHKAEDRDAFRQAMWKSVCARARTAASPPRLPKPNASWSGFGSPIVRPSFTMGGTGGNIAYNIEEFRTQVEWGLSMSPVRPGAGSNSPSSAGKSPSSK